MSFPRAMSTPEIITSAIARPRARVRALRPTVAGDTRRGRILDVGLVLLSLPLVLPLGLLTGLAIFLDSPGGVLYRSRRVGKDGVPFDMLKFRKMRHKAVGPPLTMRDDERFTPVGTFLATTKLDELPQLWNVLRGQMRLVGPRPELPDFVEQHAEAYEEILTITPGITGPAAVRYASEGHLLAQQRDPMAFYHEQLMPEKIAIDVGYVRSHSTAGDLRIIARTLLVPGARIGHNVTRGIRRHRAHAAVLVSSFLVIAALLVTTTV